MNEKSRILIFFSILTSFIYLNGNSIPSKIIPKKMIDVRKKNGHNIMHNLYKTKNNSKLVEEFRFLPGKSPPVGTTLILSTNQNPILPYYALPEWQASQGRQK